MEKGIGEEEIIKFLKGYKYDNEVYQAIQGLLDLYNKEKAKNEQLLNEQAEVRISVSADNIIRNLKNELAKQKEKNKVLELDLEEMTKSNEHKKEHWVHKAVLNSYISKDKIREILKNKGGSSFIAKADLQELLEEDNK